MRAVRSTWATMAVLLAGLAGCPLPLVAAPLSAAMFASRAPQLQGQTSVAASQAGGEQSLELLLTPFTVFTEDARIEMMGDKGRIEVLPAPKVRYFKGEIAGEPFSRLFVSVQEDGSVRGLADRDGVMWTLGAAARATGPLQLTGVDMTTPRPDGPFTCEQDKLPANASLGEVTAATPQTGSSTAAPNAALYRARVAIETDFEFYQRFNNSTAATAYVGDIIGYASTVYTAQVDTQLEVSYLRLWNTATDPWAQTGSGCALAELGQYWNTNMTGTSRTITHMLSGKSTGGGIAWVGVLCSGAFNSTISGCSLTGNIGGGYGFTGNISGNFTAGSPNIVWDVVATAHEIGHNFNSPHTHCYGGIGGNASPVDQCYGTEAGCYSGANTLPGPGGQRSGTLMSYCHLLSGGMTNIAYGFGTGHSFGTVPQRVPDRMKAHVVARATSNPTCLALGSAPAVIMKNGFE